MKARHVVLSVLVTLTLFNSVGAEAGPHRKRVRSRTANQGRLQQYFPSTQGIASGGTNEVNFGTTTAFNGSEHMSCVVQFRTATTGCNSTASVLNILRRNDNSPNRQFLLGCENNALRASVGVAAGTSLLNKSTVNDFFPTASLNTIVFYLYDGTQVDDEARLSLQVFSEYHGWVTPTLTDSGGAVPAALPTSTSNILLNPAAGTNANIWTDNLFCWPTYTLTQADICRILGGSWSGSACQEGTTPGVMANPMSAAVVPTRPSFCYVFEPGDTSTTVINRCAPGTNNGTASDGSVAYVTGTAANRLPIDSLVNSPNNKQAHTQDNWTYSDRAFRWGRGWSVLEALNSRTYNMQPKLYMVDQSRMRLMFHAGNQHADHTHFFRESMSYNRGKSFGMSGVIDWPFSAGDETGRDLSATNINTGPNGNGDRGGAVFVNPARVGSGTWAQGTAMLTWNSVPNTDQAAALTRYVRAVTATDWHSDDPTWALVGPNDYTAGGFNTASTCGGTAQWDSQAANPWLVTFAGNVIAPQYHSDTADTEYCMKMHRCSAGADCTTTAGYTGHFLMEDGDNTNPTYIPEEPTLLQFKGGPNHGRVLGCVRTDPAPPGGFQVHECGCTYTDDIDNVAGPTWAVLGADPPGADGPYGLIDWTTNNAVSCYNAPTTTQLDNGLVVMAVRTPPDGSTTNGELCVNISSDWGLTWTQATCLTANLVADARTSQIAQAVQIEPNVVQIIYSYETLENINYATGLTVELDESLTASGPMPAWANDGAQRLNDAAVTNESVIFGDLKVLKGRTAVTVEGRFRKNTVATGTEYLINQMGGTNGTDMFEIHLGATGTIGGTIENGASDCTFVSSNSVWTSDAWHHVGLTYTGGGSPSFALTVDGVSVANSCGAGSLPAAWPSPTGSEVRAGIYYDGTAACTNCFVDEVAIWNFSASVAQLLTAATTITDPRARGWDLLVDNFTINAVPMHYWTFEGNAGSDCKDSVTNNRILDYGYSYAKLWGDGQNLEAGDYGVITTAAADVTAPTLTGSLALTAGDTQITLDFPDMSDVNPDHYEVRMNVASQTPPANCSAGSVVTGCADPVASTCTATGLSNMVHYAFIVCAVDHSGNTSAGLTATTQPFVDSLRVTFDGTNEFFSAADHNDYECDDEDMLTAVVITMITTCTSGLLCDDNQFSKGPNSNVTFDMLAEFRVGGWQGRYAIGGLTNFNQTGTYLLDRWTMQVLTYDGAQVDGGDAGSDANDERLDIIASTCDSGSSPTCPALTVQAVGTNNGTIPSTLTNQATALLLAGFDAVSGFNTTGHISEAALFCNGKVTADQVNDCLFNGSHKMANLLTLSERSSGGTGCATIFSQPRAWFRFGDSDGTDIDNETTMFNRFNLGTDAAGQNIEAGDYGANSL